MLRKIFVFMMITALFTVQATATTHDGLKAVFDELTYSLSVEWDQQDRSFYEQKMENFKSSLKGLQSKGLSNQELIEFTIAQVKDQKLAKDLRTAFTMMKINDMSPTEAQRYVQKVMDKSYSRGASWSGEVVAGVIVIALILAVAAIIVGKAQVEDGCYEVYTCEDYCTGSVCYEDCGYRCFE